MDKAAMDVIVSLVSAIGVPGALIWYLWHTTSKTIPDLIDKHSTTIDGIVKEFKSELKEEREARKQEITLLKVFIREEATCRYNADHDIMGNRRRPVEQESK